MHQTIKRVSADIRAFKFNTAIAALMECLNEMTAYHREYGVTAELATATRTFILLLAPFAPHVTEELWERLGGSYSVHHQPWPQWEADWVAEEKITLVVQVNGKVRARIQTPADIDDDAAQTLALNSDAVQRHLKGRSPRRVIVVPGKLVNIVV